MVAWNHGELEKGLDIINISQGQAVKVVPFGKASSALSSGYNITYSWEYILYDCCE